MGRLIEAASLGELRKVGLSVIGFRTARCADGAREAAEFFHSPVWVKAHVPAGGRRKGGVVIFASSPARAADAASSMLAKVFRDFPIYEVLITPAVDIKHEFFAAIALDESRKGPVLLFSAHGGIDVETLAREHPNGVQIRPINILVGLQPSEAAQTVRSAGVSDMIVTPLTDVLMRLYQCFRETDARLVEINPLVESTTGNIIALSANIHIDDRAAYRHPDLVEATVPAGNGHRPFTARELAMRGVDALSEREGHIRFHEFADGDIALMVTGGGGGAIALDTLVMHGLTPAITFDISIGDIEEKLYRATQIILSRAGLKGFIAGSNFTNFAPVEVRVRGIVRALLEHPDPIDFPVVFRFCGPKQETAAQLVAALPYVEYLDERVRLDQAVERLVALVRAYAASATRA